MWQPTATTAALQARAALLKTTRLFFERRDVLEVETPLLAPYIGTDVQLQPFSVMTGPQTKKFLQTSPEFAMKRLLAAGSGPIYQICKAFRQEESGSRHCAEFTMLEWYRIGWDHYQLMDEVSDLLSETLETPQMERITFQCCFQQLCHLDPLAEDAVSKMRQLLAHHRDFDSQQLASFDRETLWDAVFSFHIQPKLGIEKPIAVTDYPAETAALAQLNPHDPRTAARFEVFYKGIELANGYYELCCPEIQRERFQADNRMRRQKGLPELPIDEHLIAALEAGLPQSAGVALGFDRLLMLKLGASHIREVISFWG